MRNDSIGLDSGRLQVATFCQYLFLWDSKVTYSGEKVAILYKRLLDITKITLEFKILLL